MKNRKLKNFQKVDEAVKVWQVKGKINTDTLGSYTGTPSKGELMPEQDADDL